LQFVARRFGMSMNLSLGYIEVILTNMYMFTMRVVYL